MKSFVFIASFVLVNLACAGEKIFIHRIQGDAFVDYIEEELSVDQDGVIEFKGLSPFPREISANSIGQFQLKMTSEQQQNFKKQLASYRQQLDKAKFKAIELKSTAQDELREEIWIGRQQLKGIEHFPSLAGLLIEIRQHFFQLKKLALDNPYKALTLHCDVLDKSNSKINCHYTNIGSQLLKTIDPTSMEGSLRCINLNKKEVHLNPGKIGDPRQLKPTIIDIKPGAKFAFQFKVNAECEVAVSIKTTDMLINKNYQQLLLGHLVSNFIAPVSKE